MQGILHIAPQRPGLALCAAWLLAISPLPAQADRPARPNPEESNPSQDLELRKAFERASERGQPLLVVRIAEPTNPIAWAMRRSRNWPRRPSSDQSGSRLALLLRNADERTLAVLARTELVAARDVDLHELLRDSRHPLGPSVPVADLLVVDPADRTIRIALRELPHASLSRLSWDERLCCAREGFSTEETEALALAARTDVAEFREAIERQLARPRSDGTSWSSPRIIALRSHTASAAVRVPAEEAAARYLEMDFPGVRWARNGRYVAAPAPLNEVCFASEWSHPHPTASHDLVFRHR